MKKILFLTNSMLFGGVEKVIATLYNNFYDKGYKCYITTVQNKECVYNLHGKKNIIPLYDNNGKGKNGQPEKKDFIKCFLKLRKLIKEIKPDVLIAMPEEVSSKAIPFILGLDCKIIVSERNNPKIMPRSKITRTLRKVFYPFVDGYVFQTKVQASFFSKGIQKKGTIIMNPLDIERLPKSNLVEKRKEIVSVGRLHEQKNHKMLIRAFSNFYKKNNDYKLVIYGDGELKEELEEYAYSMLPQGTYKFMGARNDVLDKINEASIFVLSSDYEGMPNALIEAMSIGLFCISTDCPCGGPDMLIDNYKNGILIPVGDEKALEDALIYAVNNEEEVKKMSKRATYLKEKLDPDVIASKWSEYIESIVK